MTARTHGRSEAHVCEFCETVSLHWVRWENWQGGWRYFCDNDCLAEWIAGGVVNVGREIRLERTQEEGVQTDASAGLEQLRVTLEGKVAALAADLATLEAAITQVRRRYPQVRVGREEAK